MTEFAGSFYLDRLEVTSKLIRILTHKEKNYGGITELDGIEESREYRLKSMRRMSEK